MRLASLEWRLPIVRVERGTMWPLLPLALHQLSGNAFVDWGATWDEGRAPDDYRRNSPRFQGENFDRNLQLVERVKELAG